MVRDCLAPDASGALCVFFHWRTILMVTVRGDKAGYRLAGWRLEMRRRRDTLMKMAYRVLAVFILSECAALDVMAQPAFELEPIADGAAFAKRADLAPGDTLELAVHAKNARRLIFQVRRIGTWEFEHMPLPNAATSAKPCYDGTGGEVIADYPVRVGCPSSHIQREQFGCRSDNGAWLASVNSDAECRWLKLRRPLPPISPPPLPNGRTAARAGDSGTPRQALCVVCHVEIQR